MNAVIDSNFWQEVKYRWLIFFAWMIVPAMGLFFWVVFLTSSTDVLSLLPYLAGSFLLMVPCFVHLQLLAVWHWKQRYTGTHSKLWGALFVLEFTGWSKIIYFFLHVLPDRQNQRAYFKVPPPPVRNGSDVHV
jgi:hypothetical protein